MVAGAAVLGVGIVLGLLLAGQRDMGKEAVGQATAVLAPPDTAPAEFAYLDSGRVLSYLGQIQGGLAATLTRTLNAKATTKLSATLKEIAAAEAALEASSGSSETVTFTEADRFYTLLRILRADQADGDEEGFPILLDIPASVEDERGVDAVRRLLATVEEGDFVRIRGARLYIPPYAAVLPRARFASSYLGGDLEEPARALYAPVSTKERRTVARYQRQLGPDPRVPLVIPTLGPKGGLSRVVTFFLPARYRSLSREPSLLSGVVTIVGKVVHVDARPASEASVGAFPRAYFDRETLTTFGPALERADQSLLDLLKLDRDRLIQHVRDSLTISSPVAVIIPLAIYQ